jgi:hypothetical protein
MKDLNKGMKAPNPKEHTTIDGNIKVPTGKPVSTGKKTACSHK